MGWNFGGIRAEKRNSFNTMASSSPTLSTDNEEVCNQLKFKYLSWSIAPAIRAAVHADFLIGGTGEENYK
jgi:hypothetical protein